MNRILSVLLVMGFSQMTMGKDLVGQVGDLALVQSLVPAGKVLAGTYVEKNNTDNSYTAADIADIYAKNYVVYDFNKDGIKDVVVAVEELFCDGEVTDGKCDSPYRGWSGTDRELQVYFGKKNGTYKLVAYSKNLMLGDGDGGAASRDPLIGLSVDENGLLNIEYYGGSAWKWGYTLKIQYREAANKKYGFYLAEKVTQESGPKMNEAGDMADGIFITITTQNYLTGAYSTSTTYQTGEEDDQDPAPDKVETGIKKKVFARFGALNGLSVMD